MGDIGYLYVTKPPNLTLLLQKDLNGDNSQINRRKIELESHAALVWGHRPACVCWIPSTCFCALRVVTTRKPALRAKVVPTRVNSPVPYPGKIPEGIYPTWEAAQRQSTKGANATRGNGVNAPSHFQSQVPGKPSTLKESSMVEGGWVLNTTPVDKCKLVAWAKMSAGYTTIKTAPVVWYTAILSYKWLFGPRASQSLQIHTFGKTGIADTCRCKGSVFFTLVPQ